MQLHKSIPDHAKGDYSFILFEDGTPGVTPDSTQKAHMLAHKFEEGVDPVFQIDGINDLTVSKLIRAGIASARVGSNPLAWKEGTIKSILDDKKESIDEYEFMPVTEDAIQELKPPRNDEEDFKPTNDQILPSWQNK